MSNSRLKNISGQDLAITGVPFTIAGGEIEVESEADRERLLASGYFAEIDAKKKPAKGDL